MNVERHKPVLIKEVLDYLSLKAGDAVVDATAGYGGHTAELAKSVTDSGCVLAIDQDMDAVDFCRQKFESMSQVKVVHGNFRDLKKMLKDKHMSKVNAILIDCGVSSPQLDEAKRGFSFQHEGPLDMRMNQSEENNLKRLLHETDQDELANMIYAYGDERYSRRIAKAIKNTLKDSGIKDTVELSEVIKKSVPVAYRHGRIHPATRTFQALRITVNQEMEALNQVLTDMPAVLADEGKCAVISFHSIEDRAVKTKFRELHKNKMGRIVTKKPIEPSSEEIRGNARSRSAKLRVFQKGNEA